MGFAYKSIPACLQHDDVQAHTHAEGPALKSSQSKKESCRYPEGYWNDGATQQELNAMPELKVTEQQLAVASTWDVCDKPTPMLALFRDSITQQVCS